MTPALRPICGFALIGLGLIAMPLPVLPGIPLVAAGLAVLGREHPLVKRCETLLPQAWRAKLSRVRPDSATKDSAATDSAQSANQAR